MGIVWACIAMCLVAISPILAKAGTKKTDPALAGSVAGLTYLIVFIVKSRNYFISYRYSNIPQKSWIFLIIAGIVTGLFAVFFFRALNQGEATASVPIMKCSYILTILASIVIYKTIPDVKQWVVMALMLTGTIIIVAQGGVKKQGNWLVYALLSAVFVSIAGILVKYGAGKISSDIVKFICILIGEIVLLIVTFATGGTQKVKKMSFVDGICLIASALALPFAAEFYNRAIAMIGQYAVYIYDISLLVMMIIASVAIKEKITGTKIIGAAIFILSLALR